MFEALIALRLLLERRGGCLLCAGARTNVFPSSMSRDMGGGRMAYVLRLGEPALELVDIFASAERSQVGTVEEQRAFQSLWMQQRVANPNQPCRTSLTDGVQLILVPGMGTDPRLYRPQRAAFPELISPEWLMPERRESLAHYAERLAHGIKVDRQRPVTVGGVSLGGMLSLEMAPHLGADQVLLIASCREPGAISPLLKVSERAGRVTPAVLLDFGRSLARFGVGRGGGIPADDRALLGRMVREVPLEFLRWAGRAIMEWPGRPSPSVPVHHIHGTCDWVILPSRVKADVWVQGGAHVLNMSHPVPVNQWITARLVAAES